MFFNYLKTLLLNQAWKLSGMNRKILNFLIYAK